MSGRRQRRKPIGGRYILEGKRPVLCDDLMAWARWFEAANRIVAFTELEFCRVSTVFLGLDHQFGTGPPILFETMVFHKTGDMRPEGFEQHRYATWEDAELGHAAVVRRMRELEADAVKAGARVAKRET